MFLEQLSPDDRQRLAQSNTPLAAFADVATPEQAIARLESLDMPQRSAAAQHVPTIGGLVMKPRSRACSGPGPKRWPGPASIR